MRCWEIQLARQHLAKQIEEYADAEHEPGIVVDFESMPESSQKDFQDFVHDLGAALHARNLKLMVALPAADWSYDYKYFASQADAIIMMNYDYHWPTSAPGPIAPEDWFERNIDNMLNVVPPDKIIMGIANYGYDWPAKSKTRAAPDRAGRFIPAGSCNGGRIASRTSPTIRTHSICTIPTRMRITRFTPSGCWME